MKVLANVEKKSYREQRVHIPAQSGVTIYFNDTFPNHVLFTNSSPAAIYAGLAGSVNSQNYDIAIQPYGTRLLPSLQQFTRVYVYNSGSDDTTITAKSWLGEFDPAAIAQSVEMVGAGANGLLGIVEINNILTPLPAGNNLIGAVSIAGMEKPLPTGPNNIGRVDIENAAGHAVDYKKVSAITSGKQVVKLGKGVVYQIKGDVTLYDGENQVWAKGDIGCTNGIQCNNNISLVFDAPGDAFILYK